MKIYTVFTSSIAAEPLNKRIKQLPSKRAFDNVKLRVWYVVLFRLVARDKQVMNILKQVIQAMWVDEDSLLALPGCDASAVQRLNKSSITSLLQLIKMEPQRALGTLESAIRDPEARDSAVKVPI